MFYSLTGKVINKGISHAVIECGGVGFLCYSSRFTLSDLPDDKSTATVYTHLNVREDALDLFGFSTEYELEWFKMLITVNGVGPKAALAILSELTVDELALAISAKDVKAITRANGVGPKIAQRIIIELKDKVKSVIPDADLFGDSGRVGAAMEMPHTSEAVAALTMLGYSQSEAASVVSKIDPSLSVEAIIKQALKLLSSM
ncbi:MAG: Holliday junction branch migration protein RuvA [Clostridia bacterium]|nr:Holliday junction branch migration protein RuvA [Clostridia bacterium]